MIATSHNTFAIGYLVELNLHETYPDQQMKKKTYIADILVDTTKAGYGKR